LLADIMCAHFMCLEIRHEKHAYRNQPKHYYDHNLLVSPTLHKSLQKNYAATDLDLPMQMYT